MGWWSEADLQPLWDQRRVSSVATTYETLLELSLDTFKATTHVVRVGYWDWIQSLTIESNKNEISRFWSQILIVLHLYTGFYFSIRSGNWTLRN